MAQHAEPVAEIPLVSHLPESQREQVIEAGSERSLHRGEILFHEGEPAEADRVRILAPDRLRALAEWID